MKKIYVFLAAMLLCLTSFAQTGNASGDAAAAAALPFTALHAGPSYMAMGGASLALTSSPAWASFSNTAVVPFSKKKFDVALNATVWSPASTHYIDLGVAGNIKDKFGISGGLSVGINDAFKGMDTGGNSSGSFKPMDLMANVGFSYRFIKYLSAGVNARYAMQKLSEGYTLSAALFDAFLTGSFAGVTVSAGVTDVGTKASYGKSSGMKAVYDVPSAVAGAVAYDHTFAEKHALEATAELRWYYAGFGVSASAGVSYTYNDLVAVRAGYLYGGKFCADMATLGAGVKFFGVSVDLVAGMAVGYRPVDFTMALSVGYSF